MPMNIRSIQLIFNVLIAKLTMPQYLIQQFSSLNDQLKFELCSEYYIGLLTAEALMDQLTLEMARFNSQQKQDLLSYIEDVREKHLNLVGTSGWDRDFNPLLDSLTNKLNAL